MILSHFYRQHMAIKNIKKTVCDKLYASLYTAYKIAPAMRQKFRFGALYIEQLQKNQLTIILYVFLSQLLP